MGAPVKCPRRESPEVKARPALGGAVHSIDPLLHLVGGHPAVIVSDDSDRTPVAVSVGQESAVQVGSHERRCRLLANCSMDWGRRSEGNPWVNPPLPDAALKLMILRLKAAGGGILFRGHCCLSGTGPTARQAGDLKFSGGDGSGQFGRGHGRAVSVALVL